MITRHLPQCQGGLLRLLQPAAVDPVVTRSFGKSADDEDKPARTRTHGRSPDAWRARVPPDMVKHGHKLRKEDPQAFERMRIILGYYDLPHNRHKKPATKIDKVYINTLQTLKYMGFDPMFKWELLRYKFATLNRELAPVLTETQGLVDRLRAVQGPADFVPTLPGMTAGEVQKKATSE